MAYTTMIIIDIIWALDYKLAIFIQNFTQRPSMNRQNHSRWCAVAGREVKNMHPFSGLAIFQVLLNP